MLENPNQWVSFCSILYFTAFFSFFFKRSNEHLKQLIAMVLFGVIICAISGSNLHHHPVSNHPCTTTGNYFEQTGVPIAHQNDFTSSNIFVEYSCTTVSGKVFNAVVSSTYDNYSNFPQTNTANTLYFYDAYMYIGFTQGFTENQLLNDIMALFLAISSLCISIPVFMCLYVYIRNRFFPRRRHQPGFRGSDATGSVVTV